MKPSLAAVPAPSRRSLLRLALAAAPLLAGACGGGDDGVAPPIDAPPEVPPGCIGNDVRATKTVTVSGQVVDITTGDPVGGATVDLTTGWDVTGNFPKPECPLLGSLTTDAQGRFGPLAILAGSSQNPPIVVFVVHGGGRAPTLSDNRACAAPTCNLGHTIAAPSTEVAEAWRTELAAGGMTSAATRGLVLFKYKEADGMPAAGVVPSQGTLVTTPLRPGPDVRFVDAARADLMPAAQTATTASGQALVGIDADQGAIYVGGKRGGDTWDGTGCLVVSPAIFVEDKTVTPAM
ncbi:MAG TPA: hypothetical protein VHE35_04780 [Kofleriaceae bacterium]|nr:hypothetical protein [Kofleriaceae bacterium]